ncbi:MAG TPA: hypothetical protein VGM39_06055 [Kofleriaceae bacterium]|jgi:hypothetical protein
MDPVVGRLLAGRDQLSVNEKDAMLVRVMAQSAPASKPWWAFGLAGVLAAAAVLVLVLMRGHSPASEQIASRGKAASIMRVVCAESGGIGSCQRGGKLLFDLAPAGKAYFAAFAERPDGSVIWYTPADETGTSERVTDGVAGLGIRLGDEHPTGTYRVHGVFSDEPLTREEIRAAVNADRADIVDDVRTLEVTP